MSVSSAPPRPSVNGANLAPPRPRRRRKEKLPGEWIAYAGYLGGNHGRPTRIAHYVHPGQEESYCTRVTLGHLDPDLVADRRCKLCLMYLVFDGLARIVFD